MCLCSAKSTSSNHESLIHEVEKLRENPCDFLGHEIFPWLRRPNQLFCIILINGREKSTAIRASLYQNELLFM